VGTVISVWNDCRVTWANTQTQARYMNQFPRIRPILNSHRMPAALDGEWQTRMAVRLYAFCFCWSRQERVLMERGGTTEMLVMTWQRARRMSPRAPTRTVCPCQYMAVSVVLVAIHQHDID
jgi:hypothetical protein